ncbi:MAG: ATP-binding protein [Gammaproteobacteria bacterium]|jgi:cyanophycin synthetase
MISISCSEITFFHGANYFANDSIACCHLDLKRLDSWLKKTSSEEFHAFCLANFEPDICNGLQKGAILDMIASLTLGMVVTLQERLQQNLGSPARYEAVNTNRIDLYFPFERKDIATAVLHYALCGIEASTTPPDQRDAKFQSALQPFRDRFLRFARNYAVDVQLKAVCNRAKERGIRTENIGHHTVVFGEGRYQQKRLRGFTNWTSRISLALSGNKTAALDLARSRGLPVAFHEQTRSVKEAVRSAERIGYPVVVKPHNADFGLGVSLDLRDGTAVSQAWRIAAKYSRVVLVEKQITGRDHRIFLIKGKVIAVAERRHASVCGDGRSSIRDLVVRLNEDPRRGTKATNWMVKVDCDDEMDAVLSTQGYSPDSVPAGGTIVRLRRVPSMSQGGYSVDVSALIHPDNVTIAKWAAQLFDIDMCGIDFVSPDISVSYKDNGGAICEINCSPALSPHVVAEGRQVDIVEAIVNYMFPPLAPTRITKVLLVGDRHSPAVHRAAQLVTQAMKSRTACLGVARFGEIEIDGHCLPHSALQPCTAALIGSPVIDAMVCVVDPSDFETCGLGVSECDIMALVMPDQPAGDGRGSRLWELARDIARRPPIVSDDPAAVMVQFEDRWQELIA